MLLLTGCDSAEQQNQSGSTAMNGYAGTRTCAECHEAETLSWQSSHHDLAMQEANQATALGDFNDSRFDFNGISSRFFTENNELYVETDGPDGALSVFPVRYTFGVYPLQQYLLELDNGKIQALSIAWDTRTNDNGGQRWFHIYDDLSIDHTDVLHWTQPSQNCETMCADCHSTNLISRYSVEEDRFDTTWEELNVGCEACHGPGAKHVEWAENPDPEKIDNGLELRFDESAGVNWLLNTQTGNSTRSIERTTNKELNACAGCHSRRSRIAEGNHPATPFLDNYRPATIDPPLYHPDGQILDEVYVYGSFLQSKMHTSGVTCSDCHDPHSLQLKAPAEQVCLQCHNSETFATTQHQLHEPGIANCIDCHMPATNYMQIDARNDHSFRIPRPDLSLASASPNACNQCHQDKDASWAAKVIEQAGQNDKQTADNWSAQLATANAFNNNFLKLATDRSTPEIIRASAIARLELSGQPDTLSALANDPEPLVRWGASMALGNSPPDRVIDQILNLAQSDPRAVRIAATYSLMQLPPEYLPAGSRAVIEEAYEEYKAAQLVNNERPESH
ncbi:MAG: ammonia-forming cytochrome c nitrite reductase subunit c552, partial [Gammaproteobacteria bacterium]